MSTSQVIINNFRFSGVILENNHKIRDVYVFKRGFPCPVLKLEELDEDDVIFRRQQQVLFVDPFYLYEQIYSMNVLYYLELYF